MNSPVYAYLLCAGLLLYWLARQMAAPPVLDICPGCGDAVYHAPNLPSWCPTCGRVLL